MPLSSDSERYTTQLSIVYLRGIAKISPIFQTFENLAGGEGHLVQIVDKRHFPAAFDFSAPNSSENAVYC